MGQAPNGESYNENGVGLPLIAGAGDFGSDHPQPKKYTSAPTKTCQKGDIILSIRATIGTKVLSDGKFCLGRGVASLRAKRPLEARYLWHWLSFAETSLASKGRGATFPQVSRNDIGELEIPLPPLDEQRRIAAILDKADALRRKRKRALDLTEEARNFVIEMELQETANYNSQILGSCIEFITTGGRNWSKYYSDSGSRFVRSLDVQMNEISDEDPVYVTPPDNAEARRTCTRAGDVLLTVTGSRIGRVAELPASLIGSYVSQHVAILRLNQLKLRPKFLSFYLSSREGQRQIRKWQYGQTKPGLNFKQIEGFTIPNICVERQHQLEILIERFGRLVKLNELHYLHLTKVFSSLQHRAFSGQL
jgi:type I restriction enzyme S subunit